MSVRGTVSFFTVAVVLPSEPRASRACAAGSAKRRGKAPSTLLLLSAFALNACGFTPAYSTEERAKYATQIESVEIVTPKTRLAQLLKSEIIDQTNPAAIGAEKVFTLNINFSENEIQLFINPDGTSARGDYQFSSTYSLSRKSDGKLIDSGTLNRTSSYNVAQTADADYATYVSREDARNRGILELAQDYKLRLVNLLPKINDPHAKPVVPVVPVTTPNTRPLQAPASTFNMDMYGNVNETVGPGL